MNMEILEGKILLWLESARFVKNKPGVYVLYDKKLNALYIGKVIVFRKNLKSMLIQTLGMMNVNKKLIHIKDYLLKIQKNE